MNIANPVEAAGSGKQSYSAATVILVVVVDGVPVNKV
jgi:hypothetical protein